MQMPITAVVTISGREGRFPSGPLWPWGKYRATVKGQGVETVTGNDGRFRLEGFLPGFAYAFAEKKGCRLAGVRVRTDEDW